MPDYRGEIYSALGSVEEGNTKPSRELKNFNSQFKNADLRGAKFINLYIKDSDFSGALLNGATFINTTLDSVNFSNIKTGMTSRWIFLLRAICLPLVLIAGTVYGYSFFSLRNIAFESVSNTNATGEYVIGVVMSFSLITALGMIYFIGIHFIFSIFVVIVSLISLTVIATQEEAYAIQAVLGITGFIGALSGFIVQLQGFHLNSRLDERPIQFFQDQINKSNDEDKEKLRLKCSRYKLVTKLRQFILFTILFLGVFTGAILSLRDNHDLEIWIFITVLGLTLLSYIFSERTIFDRTSKYTIIRFLFDLSVQKLDTQFIDANFRNVELEGAELRYARTYAEAEGETNFNKVPGVNVLNRKILVPEEAGRASDSSRSGPTNFLGNIGVVVMQQGDSKVDVTESTNYDLSNAEFGGGFAAKGGNQEGGQFIDVAHKQDFNQPIEDTQELLE